MFTPRILIVKLSSIGDILHVLPVVHALRTQMHAEVHWAVQREYVDLVRCFADVSRVIAVPRHPWWRGLTTSVAELRRDGYDLVVDLQGLLKSAFVTRLARAPRRIGPSYAREGSALFYTELAGKRDTARHAVEQAEDVLDLLELSHPSFIAAPISSATIKLPGGRPCIGLLPMSRWPTKNWPVSHFATLARRLAKERDATLLVLGGAADAAAGERIRREAPDAVVNLCGRYLLSELFGVLRQLDLLIANDSGPVHMAAALGRPTLVLFGPTRPGRTGPYGGGHRVLMRDLPCQPCLSRRCRIGGQPCLNGLMPDEVFAVATEMLDAQPLLSQK